ncbi:MAG: hypothetical protein HY586_02235 [Candidatus Omnitrophica bacterium]|nr:hypothetical protein [Candidatus Omnitrophota bacterium]
MRGRLGEYARYKPVFVEAIREHVCRHCIDFGNDGTCQTIDPLGCAIFRHLPKLIHIAGTLHETKIEPYIETVRKDICRKCRALNPDGSCWLRSRVDCGLDRYLILVFEALEEAWDVIRTKQKTLSSANQTD